LLNNKKVAGLLTDNYWSGDDLVAVILGFGINVTAGAIDPRILPVSSFAFPATCVEDALGRPVDRLELLHAVLQAYFAWRPRITSPDFMRQWEANLAFLGEWVQVTTGESYGKDGLPVSLEKTPTLFGDGKVVGLAPDGALKLLTRSGETVTAQYGEVRLRPKN
jgi:biotin-(acetyl-CoA carboxylase) ligase